MGTRKKKGINTGDGSLSTHSVSAEVTAMTRSWRRARALCMHLSGIPPRLQAGILTHTGTARLEKAGAPAETTQPLVPHTHYLQHQSASAWHSQGWQSCMREHRPSSNSHFHHQQHPEVTDTWKTEVRSGIWHLNLLKLHGETVESNE